MGFYASSDVLRDPVPIDEWTETQVVQWIEQVTLQCRDELCTAEWLRTGVVLCQLVNKIVPGLIHVSQGAAEYRMMENIDKFLKVAKSFGLREWERFELLDLFEARDMGRVINCLYSFAEVIPQAVPRYEGPFLAGAAPGRC